MAENQMVLFKKGLAAKLPSTRDAKTLYFVTDEGKLYLGNDLIADKTGDYATAISNAIAALDETVKDESGLVKVTVVETDGKLTSVTVDQAALLEKFAEYYTSGQIDEKIGELKIGDVTYDSVVDYVVAKTTGIATDAVVQGKADKKIPAVVGNIATLDAEGNLADGGETIAQLKQYAKVEAGTAAGTAKNEAEVAAQNYTRDAINGLDFALSEDGKELALKDKNGDTITTLDTTEFVVDGFLTRVVSDQAANTLTFYWNTDSGEDSTVVNLSDIADIYTGSTNVDEVNVAVSNTNVITATLGDNVKAAIAKGVTAHGWGDHAQEGYLKAGDIAGKADRGDLDAYVLKADAEGYDDIWTETNHKAFVSAYGPVLNSGITSEKITYYDGIGSTVINNRTNWDKAPEALSTANDAYELAGTKATLVEAKNAIQGGTTNTVKDCVDAINAMNNKTGEVSENVQNIVAQLTWGEF